MVRRALALAVIAALPSIADVCPDRARVTRVTVVLLDLSESTNQPTTRQIYCENVSAVLRSLSYGDAFAAAWITEHSIRELELAADTVLPAVNDRLMTDWQRHAARQKAALVGGSIAEKICKRLTEPGRTVRRTDIMSSMVLIQSVLERRPAAEKRLIILSDMIEDSERYDFETLQLTPETRARIIQREREEQRLPQLAGVRVCVAGAGGRGQKFFEIRDFWRQYFTAAGAVLESYGGPLLGCQ